MGGNAATMSSKEMTKMFHEYKKKKHEQLYLI